MMKRAFQVGTVVLVASVAIAQQSRVYRDGNSWVEEVTGTMPAAASVRVTTHVGSVAVRGGSSQGITYTIKKRVRGVGSEQQARERLNALRLRAAREGESAVIQGVGAGHLQNLSADFALHVPTSIGAVKVNTYGGSVTVIGVGGRVTTNTVGGNVVLDDVGGPIHASSAGGNVDVGVARSDVAVTTGGGHVRIRSASGIVKSSTGGGNITIGSGRAMVVRTGGGTIDVDQCNGEISVVSGGGSLDLGRVAGRAMIETGGGSIKLANATGPVSARTAGGSIEVWGLQQGARVETGGGSITAEFLPGNFTGSTLETPFGDIIVYLSPDLKANVRAVIDIADGHRIRTELPAINVRRGGGNYGPRVITAEGVLNGGGPLLTVHTTNGDIEFRKSKK